MKNAYHTPRPADRDHPLAGPQVILSIRGGMLDILHKPTGIVLTVFDYDIEGEDGLSTDADGKDCLVRLWPASQEEAENRHWPMIRQALRAARRSDGRTWKCPDCDQTVNLTYEELAEAGAPYCTECDSEMQLS